MTDDLMAELLSHKWMQSRVPALDALVAFVPDGTRDPEVDALAASHPSRWYPVTGGVRVVILYEPKEAYDATRFRMEPGAWDHEHCALCRDQIAPMTLCWVTVSGAYITLCERCYAKVALTS